MYKKICYKIKQNILNFYTKLITNVYLEHFIIETILNDIYLT